MSFCAVLVVPMLLFFLVVTDNQTTANMEIAGRPQAQNMF